MNKEFDDIIISFPVQLVKNKIKEKGYRQTSRNISLVLLSIKQWLTDNQLVSTTIDKTIDSLKDRLDKPLED